MRPLDSASISTWPEIRSEIEDLRRHVRFATSDSDLRNIGNDCVVISEKLSEFTYLHARHGKDYETEPPISKTKIRLLSLVEHEYLLDSKSELKRLISSSIELAQAVKHSHHPTALESLILADSLIFLVTIIERILNQNRNFEIE
jgi:hypothetical protein